MNSDEWNKLNILYDSALDFPASDRSAFVEQHCTDENLRRDVLSLLASADRVDSFLEEPVADLALSLLNSETTELVGATLGRYRILKLLGHGGMGEVYLAHDPSLSRKVALKLLPESITDNHVRVLRFQQEARAASAISHPNVAHIYEIGEANGRHYITMEYIKGPTLRELLKTQSLDLPKVLNIAAQVCNALAAAHKAGVIHRDIKPENIVLTNDGYVKVLDFGLAKLIEGSREDSEVTLELSSLHTQPELLMGTSHYMSPEQVRRQLVDHRTDLWSLGIVLYEMLFQRRPFSGGVFSEVIVAILELEVDVNVTREGQLPNDIRSVLVKSLQKDPDARYQSADEMLRDLRQVSLVRPLPPDPSLEPGVDLKPNGVEKKPGGKSAFRTVVTTEIGRPKTVAERIDTIEDGPTKNEPRILAGVAFRRWSLAIPLLLILAAGIYFGRLKVPDRTLLNRPVNLGFERLTLSGDIADIVISPDGKYVAYIVVEAGKHSIHVTELASTSDLRVTPLSDKTYSGLSFSPDGTFVYYLERQAETGTLYRVSKLGGAQRKILDNVNTAVTFSPDGSRIAFVRSNNSVDPADLVVAQSDGSAPMVLVKRTLDDKRFFFSDMGGPGPVWSPDGTTIACATHGLGEKLTEVLVEAIDIESKVARRVSIAPWWEISRMVWLADGSGLIVAAAETRTGPSQLHLLGSSGNKVSRLTNDPNNYTLVSGSRDSAVFLTRNIEESSTLWRISVSDSSAATLNLGQKKGLAEVERGNDAALIFTVVDGKNANLWLQDAKGIRQVTFEGDNFKSTVTPDGRYIVFVSSRAGTMNIWRMNPDGTNPAKLTSGPYEDVPSVTPDGQWVIYRTGNDIRKVSIDGGTAVNVLNKSALCPALSPDGRLLAFFANDNPDSQIWHVEVHDLQSNLMVKRFALPDSTTPFNGLTLTPDNRLRWTPDGKALTYVSSSDGASNIWIQSLQGGPFKKLSNFNDAEIISFTWADDGREILAVRNTRAYVPVLVRLF